MQTSFNPTFLLLFPLTSLFSLSSAQQLFNDSIAVSKFRPSYSNEYVCKAQKLQHWTYYVRSFAPSDPYAAAHHIMLYACIKPGSTEEIWECGEMTKEGSKKTNLKSGVVCEGEQTILFASAMGSGSYELPRDVSFKIGKDTIYQYLVVQIHYKDVDQFEKDPELEDNSGMWFSYQKTPTSLAAGVILLGSNGLVYPDSWTRSGRETLDVFCPPESLKRRQTIVPFAYRTHAHSHGILITGFRIRDTGYGTDAWDPIGRMSPQLEQTFYPVEEEMLIEPSDSLAARCLYTNPTDDIVRIGPTADDEMCNFYVLYYTLDGTELDGETICFGTGLNSWDELLYPQAVPDWVNELSLNLTPKEAEVVSDAMEEKRMMDLKGH